MSGRIYIAGPMTGLPDQNYPAFHAEAQRLRSAGWHVESPAESPVPPCGGTWEGYMRLSLAKLVTCDSVVFLPGWTASRGAKLEHQVALQLGLAVVYHAPPPYKPADLSTFF